MPGQVTSGSEDLELEPEESEEETESTEESESTEEPKVEDKRISDLQSAKDKETARANKAEQLLKKLSAGEGTQSGGQDPEREALLTELREASLDAVFGDFPELKSYGIDRSLIEGSTRAEMRESATALVGLVKSVATKERNRVLKEHGITAESTGAAKGPSKSYAEMSNEEIEKEAQRAKSGGPSFW